MPSENTGRMPVPPSMLPRDAAGVKRMKILDRYVAKSFLVGCAIALFVLIGLRIIIDLFVNLDEFAEHAIELGVLGVVRNILTFYALNSTLYFRDFSGMIIVVAAAFSLGKMVRSNELTAMMASGVSLKRVIAPIVILSLLLTGLLVIDQELVIPPLSDKLVRGQDAIPGQEMYNVWFISDGKGSLICAPNFDVESSTLVSPVIITRQRRSGTVVWQPTGYIEAESATYEPQSGQWLLTGGMFTPIAEPGRARGMEAFSEAGRRAIAAYETDVTPKDIPVRRKSKYKTLLSSRQLSTLAAQGTKIKDLPQLYSQKHFRVTDPIMNVVMLMVCLPILVCRDPRTMKTAIAASFGVTAACLVVNFVCKLLATESVFGITVPAFWAWLPVFIFAPIAFIELDSMKT